MKKKLSADALDILAVSALGGWPMRNQDLSPVAELVTRGFIATDPDAGGVMLVPTTAGLRAAIDAGLITQNGTRFALADGYAPIRQPVTISMSTQLRPPLRVVEPRAPDPFKEGMDVAINGGSSLTSPYPTNSVEHVDWYAGYDAGLTVKVRGV